MKNFAKLVIDSFNDFQNLQEKFEGIPTSKFWFIYFLYGYVCRLNNIKLKDVHSSADPDKQPIVNYFVLFGYTACDLNIKGEKNDTNP